MSQFDRQEFDKLMGENTIKRLEKQRDHLEYQKQAEVSATLLTGDQNWDVFLQFLQSAVDTTKAQKTSLEERYLDPGLVNPDEIMKDKILIMLCAERIKAWETVIALPVDIMSQGEKARSLLARLGEAKTEEAA
jgi:hypothetical protein